MDISSTQTPIAFVHHSPERRSVFEDFATKNRDAEFEAGASGEARRVSGSNMVQIAFLASLSKYTPIKGHFVSAVLTNSASGIPSPDSNLSYPAKHTFFICYKAITIFPWIWILNCS